MEKVKRIVYDADKNAGQRKNLLHQSAIRIVKKLLKNFFTLNQIEHS